MLPYHDKKLTFFIMLKFVFDFQRFMCRNEWHDYTTKDVVSSNPIIILGRFLKIYNVNVFLKELSSLLYALYFVFTFYNLA